MARNLYRVYLYVVGMGSFIIAAVGVYFLLDALLIETQLRGAGQLAPTWNEQVQRILLGIVLLVVGGALCGLHYWLMRRDLLHDPAAGGSAIRAFFLNLGEAGAMVVALSTATSALSGLANNGAPVQPPYYGGYDASGPIAAALAAFAIAAMLEWERRRTKAAPGVATIFQRLHFYGVPLVIVLIAAGAIQSAIQQTTGAMLYAAGQYPACSASMYTKAIVGPCYSQPNLLPLWAGALLVAGAWAAYILLVRGDTRSSLRQVAHLLGFTIGLIFALVGLERGIELGMRGLVGVSISWVDMVTSYEFISTLLFGLIVALAYGIWLRQEAAALPMGATATTLSVEAIAAAGFSVALGWGGGFILRNIVESFAAPVAPDAAAWATALALAITGLPAIPLAVDIYLRTARTGVTGPHRALVFGSLAASALTAAVGAAIALYALGTVLLNAELSNWQEVARTGGVVFVVGLVGVVIYAWLGIHLRYFKAAPHMPEEAVVEAVAQPETIEEVLDAFAAGKMTRDEAASRIHQMEKQIENRHPLPA